MELETNMKSPKLFPFVKIVCVCVCVCAGGGGIQVYFK